MCPSLIRRVKTEDVLVRALIDYIIQSLHVNEIVYTSDHAIQTADSAYNQEGTQLSPNHLLRERVESGDETTVISSTSLTQAEVCSK